MKSFFLHKTRFIQVVTFLCVILFISCEDILEEEPFTEIGTEFFYQDEKDALAALNAVYAQLKEGVGYYRQQYLSNLFAASDQGRSSDNHGNFRKGTITSTDQNLPNTWEQIYIGIKDANNVIARVPQIEGMNEELKARVVGEARFLRGLNYFNLVRCFGEVPLRTEPVQPGEAGLPVSPIQDIYDVIISDFQHAAENCWGFNETRNGYKNNIGRVTKASAHAMLAKVYIQIASSKRTAEAGVMGNERYLGFTDSATSYYQLAKEQCDLVLGESGYQLVADLDGWKKIFESTNGNNAEMLFEIQGSSITGQGTAVSNLFSPRNAGLSGGGWGGTNRFQPKFINKNINKYDKRFQNSIIKEFQNETKTFVIKPNSSGYFRTVTATGAADGGIDVVYTSKYIDTDATTEYTSQQNWHVIRLADVYLMRAEALAEISQDPTQANADLSILRNRVDMKNFEGAGMSMEDFRTALLRERGAELSMEGHRFFDLTRMGVYDEYCRVSYGNTIGARQPEDYTWPIPLIESSSNENIN
ncbi:RagB/SusD family nutrient uptake outer membrane protein [Tenacibaculum tangerinum]|uniref:RagB/SusD family nutrient uptake outer membrane protein n=1 Tax=Tenacibaculum tangerinum TaxID=3038772 RepID=A0ABY8L0I4_9FLAO|nr:RagB/SusD family nutrient uptake outer membrane protein [Tenacibaculum tangerinum]WGH74981.1 RagB/SusD family nutrient uptake outer membrane protein [Tenacibaculum tangerinum]